MSEKATTPRFRMARALRQIASPYAFRNETLAASAIPILLANLVLDFGRLGGTLSTWLFISALGYLAAMFVPLIIKLLTRGRALPSFVYLVTFAVAGMLRGCVIFLVGRQAGVITEDQWSYRFWGSTLYVFLSMSLVAVLVSNSLRATEALQALSASRQVLEKRLRSMRGEISRMNAEVAGRVSGLISPIIQELIDNLKGAKAKELALEVKALRATVDNVVRPLSLDIAEGPVELLEPQASSARMASALSWRIGARVQISNQIVPFWSSVLICIVASPAAIVLYESNAFAALSLLGLSTFVVLFVAELALRRVWLPAAAAFALQLAIFAIAGTCSTAVLVLLTNLGPYSWGRIISLTMIAGTAFFVGQVRQTQRAESTKHAIEVNTELEMLNSQARRELWLNRRRIATVLHGPVQAALYASAMRLAQASRPSKKLIQSVNADLETALEVLKFDSLDSPDWRSVLGQIVEVWEGTCEIYVSVPKSVYQITKKNALLSEALVEVLREAISNAIKHGGASEIEVEAKLSAKFIDVSIVNNGRAPINKSGTGFGSKLYNELTHSWSLAETADGRTKFGATIFIA
jgi:signal transduction histidine kinase